MKQVKMNCKLKWNVHVDMVESYFSLMSELKKQAIKLRM